MTYQTAIFAPDAVELPTRVMKLLRLMDREQLGALADATIARLDQLEPDPDLEDGDEDCCVAGDDDTRSRRFGPDDHPGDPDDAEDDTEDMCLAGDDGCGPFWREGVMSWGSEFANTAEWAPKAVPSNGALAA